jgi:hypothetical protein
MNTDSLEQAELAEILQLAQEGEQKLREMSDRATIIAEKWRIKTQDLEQPIVRTESAIALSEKISSEI